MTEIKVGDLARVIGPEGDTGLNVKVLKIWKANQSNGKKIVAKCEWKQGNGLIVNQTFLLEILEKVNNKLNLHSKDDFFSNLKKVASYDPRKNELKTL